MFCSMTNGRDLPEDEAKQQRVHRRESKNVRETESEIQKKKWRHREETFKPLNLCVSEPTLLLQLPSQMFLSLTPVEVEGFNSLLQQF